MSSRKDSTPTNTLRKTSLRKRLAGWATRQRLVAGALILGAIAVAGFLVAAFSSHEQPDSTQPAQHSETAAPAFSIPKVVGCQPAPADAVATINPTLRPRLQLHNAQSTSDGGDTYIAAQLESEGVVVREDPALWVIRNSRIYAVGATTTISTAGTANTIRVFGDTDAAATAVSCAAGY